MPLDICRNDRGTAVRIDGIGEAHKEGIFNVWAAAEAFGDEIYQVSIVLKCMVQRAIL